MENQSSPQAGMPGSHFLKQPSMEGTWGTLLSVELEVKTSSVYVDQAMPEYFFEF